MRTAHLKKGEEEEMSHKEEKKSIGSQKEEGDWQFLSREVSAKANTTLASC